MSDLALLNKLGGKFNKHGIPMQKILYYLHTGMQSGKSTCFAKVAVKNNQHYTAKYFKYILYVSKTTTATTVYQLHDPFNYLALVSEKMYILHVSVPVQRLGPLNQWFRNRQLAANRNTNKVVNSQ